MESFIVEGSTYAPLDPEKATSLKRKRRRNGDILDKATMTKNGIPKIKAYSKTPEERQRIYQAVTHCELFGVLLEEEINEVISAMTLVKKEDTEELFSAGDIGDKFYIINSGSVRFLDAEDNKKYIKTVGESFGEMGLLHDNPRRFTVICEGNVDLWQLTRENYRNLIISSSERSANKVCHALETSEAFSSFSPEQITKIADCCRVEKLEPGKTKKGNERDTMYLVLSGSVDCVYLDKNGEVAKEIKYVPGNFFGDFTIYGKPRDVQIIAEEFAECIIIERDEFIRNLGPIEDAMNFKEKLNVIQGFKGFDQLDPEYLRKLVSQFDIKTFKHGTKIIAEGQEGSGFYHIQKGHVRVVGHISKTTTEDVSVLSAGEFFGEASLLLKERCNADIIAEGDVECYVLSREEFNNLSKPIKSQLFKVLHTRTRRTRRTIVRKTLEILKKIELKDFEALATLGSGKYGLVKLVKNQAIKQAFALKTLQKGRIIRDNQVEELLNEKQILKECDHPFIVKLYRTYKDNVNVYLLLEYVQGGELFSLLHSQNTLSEESTKFYAADNIQACIVEALVYLHNNSIIYRDLKPENTMIDNQGYIRLVDMGFSRKLEFKAYTMCGTPQYIAPEILIRRGYNRSVDYWTLGILIYELLSGQTPFYDKDINTMYEKILHFKHVPFAEDFPESAKPIVAGLLRKRPRTRLGMHRNGKSVLKNHEWFTGIDWLKLYYKELQAPWKPDIQGSTDTSYFLEYDEKDNPLIEEFDEFHYKDNPEIWKDF